MNIKRITCFFLCTILLTSCTACKKKDSISKESSYTSTATSIQSSSVVSKPVSSVNESTISSDYQSSSIDTSLSSISSKLESIVSVNSISSTKSSKVKTSSKKQTSSKTQTSITTPSASSSSIITSTVETSSKTETSISTSSSNTSSRPKYEADDYLTPEDFNFKSIKQVNCFCVKNIPNSDLVYAVTDIITDTEEEISIGCKLFSDDPNIKINQKTITIPYSYKSKYNSVKITVRHTITKISYDLIITFEKDWDMIFEDEFNGTELDTNVWEHRPEWLRDKGYVNYFSKQMTFLDGEGHLVSRAAPGKKVIWDYSTKSYKEIDAYLSGAVSTKDLFTSNYGYYEASVKLHHQTGMWGAFWLVCGDMDSTTAAADKSSTNGCEIDVFESLYNHGGVSQNLHWDGFQGNTCSAPSNGYVTQIDTYDNEYHTFAVSWTPNEYVFLVDGIVTRRINAKTAGGICNQDGYMLITTECGTWAGGWVLKDGEYSDMLVDYVRVYSYPEK